MRAAVFIVIGLVPLLACGTYLSLDGRVELADAGDSSVPDAARLDCTGRRQPITSDLYATTTGSPDAGCGLREPCTLSAALERARDGGAIINVSEGLYDGDIVLPAQTRIIGGWRVDTIGEWVPICDERIVQIRGSSASAVVKAIDVPEARLDLLTVLPAPGLPKPAESRYGVLARGGATSLTLENVAVIAGPGGDGDAGAPGTNAADTIGAGCAPSTGAAGTDGTTGTSTTGAFGHDGYAAAQATNGQPGTAGSAGTGGGAGPVVSGTFCNFDGTNCSNVGCSEQGPPGLAGCGGAPGTAGIGGTGGGGSFGIFAWDGAHVTLLAGSVIAMAGGRGGNGGAAGRGGSGSVGVSPTGQTQCAGVGCSSGCGTFYYPIGGGAAGGPGGRGGNAGAGGGGAGGPSFAIVSGSGANVEVTGTELTFDRGGEGGQPNGSSGPSGARGP